MSFVEARIEPELAAASVLPTPGGTAHAKVDAALMPTLNGDATAELEASRPGVEVLDPLSSPTFGAGDAVLDTTFLSVAEADRLLQELLEGVQWQQWYHQPALADPKRRKKCSTVPEPLRRLKIAAANVEADGRIPWYRFPVNNQQEHGITTPMPDPVERLRKQVVAATGVEYNHAVVLLYRGADDCIGFHKDKTLDLDEGSDIISVSLGKERPYVLRNDILKPTKEEEVVLAHGSMLRLGPVSNKTLFHSVRRLGATEQPPKVRLQQDTDVRVSVTFRKVVSYVDADWHLSGAGSRYSDVNWPKALKGRHVNMLDAPTDPQDLQDNSQVSTEDEVTTVEHVELAAA